MSAIGWQELLFIMLIALLFFGAGRLPEVGRALGKAIKEFKKGMQALSDSVEEDPDKDKKNDG